MDKVSMEIYFHVVILTGKRQFINATSVKTMLLNLGDAYKKYHSS